MASVHHCADIVLSQPRVGQTDSIVPPPHRRPTRAKLDFVSLGCPACPRTHEGPRTLFRRPSRLRARAFRVSAVFCSAGASLVARSSRSTFGPVDYLGSSAGPPVTGRRTPATRKSPRRSLPRAECRGDLLCAATVHQRVQKSRGSLYVDGGESCLGVGGCSGDVVLRGVGFGCRSL